MRKLWLLVLWLLCGAILPLTTNAKIEDGIYTVEGWHKTVIRSGIQLTLASGALEWTYYRGFNENTDNSEWIGDWNDWTWTYYFWGKMYGNTNTVDDAWWGSGDNVENWFNSWLNPARQWPCESWRHVPSKWERSNLHIARCNNDVSCDVSVDLNIDNEKIAYIDNLVAKFSETFNIQIWWGSEYWLSSPYYNLKNSGSLVYRYYDGVTIDVGSRQQNYKVLCFKDVIIKPQTYKVSFFSGNQLVTSWEIIDGWLRNEDIPSATKEWYDFDYRYVEWAEDTGFNFSGTAITWNISLYAKWTPVEYAITYELDGWTNSENNVTWYTIETPDITFANPTKEWYNFDGWFTDTQFTTWVTTIPTWTTWNITLYAKWTPVEYAITYELDGWMDGLQIHSLLHELQLSQHELLEISLYMPNGLKIKSLHDQVDEVVEVATLQTKIKILQITPQSQMWQLPLKVEHNEIAMMVRPFQGEIRLQPRGVLHKTIHRNSKKLMNLQKKNELQLC